MSNDPRFNLENLRIDPESLGYLPTTKSPGDGTVKRRSLAPDHFRFYLLPVNVYKRLNRIDQGFKPAFILWTVLFELWFRNLHRNPLRLSSRHLQKYKMSRSHKKRGLQALERVGVIQIERITGKNPLITLNWLPLKE